jgi:hypothetical protein
MSIQQNSSLNTVIINKYNCKCSKNHQKIALFTYFVKDVLIRTFVQREEQKKTKTQNQPKPTPQQQQQQRDERRKEKGTSKQTRGAAM